MKKFIYVFCALVLLSLLVTTTGCNSSAKREQAIADSIARADSIAKADSIARADSIANVTKVLSKASDKIREFYNNYVFGSNSATRSVVSQYCTEKLAQKLIEYEYEGGDIDLWMFRSGNQDGDSDVSTLTDVEDLGNGKFKAQFFDMGAVGSRIITCVVSGDDVLFDEVDTSSK